MGRLATWWEAVRDSLWFLPAVFTAAAGGLAFTTIRIDRTLLADAQLQAPYLLGVGAEGARGILDAVSSSIITVTGVVFSITIVALQLASNQFTPRLLRNFTADRANQVVLGIFIGTFTYALLVEGTIRSGPEREFVPTISVAIAVGLALVSIGALIFYINHASRIIQVSVIIDRVTHDTLRVVDKLFPEEFGRPLRSAAAAALPAGPSVQISTETGGFLQAVDEESIFEEAARGGYTVRMDIRIGDFVLPGATLATAWPRDRIDEELKRSIESAFVLGPERTPHQDVDFGVLELMDIAVKALSPSVNDPTTAIHCVDRLGELLVHLGRRNEPVRERTDSRGRVRFISRPASFERTVSLAFDQIRHFGADNPAVVRRLIQMLGQVAVLTPAARHGPLEHQAAELLAAAGRALKDHDALADLRRLAAPLLAGADPARHGPGSGAEAA